MIDNPFRNQVSQSNPERMMFNQRDSTPRSFNARVSNEYVQNQYQTPRDKTNNIALNNLQSPEIAAGQPGMAFDNISPIRHSLFISS